MVYQFDWDAGGYGCGVKLVAAENKEQAIEHANFNCYRKYWQFDCEREDIQYVGNAELPYVLIEMQYQE